ncbi:MAG: hypothetical protein HGA22_09835 [Clostridiales bacterium]|nr:hypothetical protein [Clostridiales bacterium]
MNTCLYVIKKRTAIAVCLALLLAMTGCSGKDESLGAGGDAQASATGQSEAQNGNTQTAVSGEASDVPAASITAAEPATTAASSTPATAAPASPVTNETEKAYIAKINAYLSQLPAEKTGVAAASEEQAKLVADMLSLYDKKATSKEIFALYKKGITVLSPENADKFTAAAISGMRRNSFNDYTYIEKNFTNKAGFLDTFFKEAEVYGFNYVTFNHNSGAIKDAKVKELVETAAEQGYYAASTEGMVYYLVDFTEFAGYRSYNSPQMAALIETLAIDAIDPMSADGGFTVDGATLAARTYGIEKMLKDYKGTKYEQYLAVRFRDHMTMLLYGLDNTPTFSYDTGLLTDKAKSLVQDIETMDDTFMGQLVKEFSTILDANGGRIDDASREKAQEIFRKIDAKYSISDETVNEYGQWMSGGDK